MVGIRLAPAPATLGAQGRPARSHHGAVDRRALRNASLADRFDGSLEEVFELQDQVAISAAGIVEPTLQAAEIRRSSCRPTNDLAAYDLYLRGLSHWGSGQKDRVLQALDLLEHSGSRRTTGWTTLRLTVARVSIWLARRSGCPLTTPTSMSP
jgi:hypothetical protein